MSNSLAIATVTGALKHFLSEALNKQPTTVSAKAQTILPNDLTKNANTAAVNIFLYRATPNAARRNADLPSRSFDGQLLQRPRIALDLHYLLSFTGDESKLEPQRVMGIVLHALHAQPVLTRKAIEDAINDNTLAFLKGSNLADEIETAKFTPLSLSLDELSKLWSVFFQTPYRLSVVYKASVVYIEKEETPLYILPVKERSIAISPSLQAPAITPDQLAGLQVWLKSDAGLSYDTQGVSAWADQSGNGNQAIQNAPNLRPLLAPHGLGSYPVLRFDGDDDYLAIQALSYNASLSGITVCALVRSTSSQNQIIVSFDGSEYWHLALKEGSTTRANWKTKETGGNSKNLPSASTDIPVYTDGKWHFLCGWFQQGANPDKRLFVDGAEAASKNAHNGKAVGSSANRFGLIGVGSESAQQNDGKTGPDWFLKGDVAELMIYDRALSDEERNGLENYILKRYTTPKNAEAIVNG